MVSPCKEMQDSLEFLIPRCGFQIPRYWILDSNHFSWYLKMLNSRFQSPRFQIPQEKFPGFWISEAKLFQITESEFPYMRRLWPGSVQSSVIIGWGLGVLNKNYTGRPCSDVQPLTLLYIIFHEKGTPFTYLIYNFASLLTAVNALSLK